MEYSQDDILFLHKNDLYPDMVVIRQEKFIFRQELRMNLKHLTIHLCELCGLPLRSQRKATHLSILIL